jgi:LysR family transcriptional regulator, hypochlorite-specific transcription factor HypT
VQVRTGSILDATNLLVNGEADLMLAYAHPDLPITLDATQFEYRTIGFEQLIAVSGVDDHGKATHSISAGKPFAYLAFNRALILGRVIETHLRTSAKGSKLKPRVVLEGDFAESLHECANLGLGIAWLPQTLVAQDLQRARLVNVQPKQSLAIEIRLYRARQGNRNTLSQGLFEE